MAEKNEVEGVKSRRTAILNRFRLQDRNTALLTVFYGVLGGLLYCLVTLVPMPYTMVSIFKFGLLPSVVIIALAGAIRGPAAGFLTGYLGEIFYGLVLYNHIIAFTLQAMAYGILGLLVGVATYDFARGRSLAKLSVFSILGFVIAVLLSVVVGISVVGYSVMAAIAFYLLPEMTTGLLTLLFLTPVLARLWYGIAGRITTGVSMETTA